MGIIERLRLLRRVWKDSAVSPVTECQIIELLLQMQNDGEIKQCFECGVWFLSDSAHHHDFVV